MASEKEVKWTPGPWYAVRNSAFWEINPQREYGDDHIPYSVADVCASDPRDTTGLQKDNAHLIAAAPDLYEALAEILVTVSYHDIHPATYDAARAALAKARGE